MLTIRAEQMEAFEQAAQRRFEDEMVAHGKGFAPRLAEVIGNEQLRVAVRSAINRARGHGFTYRGPIRLFVELTFLCGSSFDTDPQFAALGGALCTPGDQMVRAGLMHQRHNDYLARVAGPGNANVHAALKRVLAFARSPLEIDQSNLSSAVIDAMKQAFAQKAAYSGDAALRAIIAEAVDEAARCGFSGARPSVLLAVLRFAFGNGCTCDPLYPWIAQTLQDPRIAGPQARAARLEKKALTWLEHVVAGNESRSRQ